jgi:ABC-type proline/glycine betaine transport system ATPase subunit
MNKNQLEKLQKLFQGEPEEVPKGWYTVRQLMEITGKGRTTIIGMISKHINAKSGEVKMKEFNIRQKKAVRLVPHYFFKL